MSGAVSNGDSSPAIGDLRSRLADIYDLGRATALLGWDERTYMPPGGAEPRSRVSGTIARLRHEMFCDERVGELLATARGELGLPDPLDPVAEVLSGAQAEAEPIDTSLVRLTSRDWVKARRVPAELQEEMARQSTIAEHAWVAARAESDFAGFAPQLERSVELTREYAACYEGFPGFEHAYDALLDEYEPGMKTEEIAKVLGDLREGLVPIVEGLPEASGETDVGSTLHGTFDPAVQRRLVARLLDELPLPEDGWRIDDTTHPFAVSIAPSDIRLTTRYEPGYLGTGIWGALHESGHGMYEAGVDPALGRTSLAKPRSLGLHESQSRLWENWVGRSRPYMSRLLPQLREFFPDAFGGIDSEQLYADANRAARSLIRVEADELTYNLHILIRFELELALFVGDLEVAELPEAWNARYRDYLGLDVPDDAHGVLQDVHWAGGAFGYFPTYSLGNVIAGQLWPAAQRDIPDLDGKIAAGDFMPLGEWLGEHVHRHGRRLGPAQVLERAGCGELSVEPLLDHLRSKL